MLIFSVLFHLTKCPQAKDLNEESVISSHLESLTKGMTHPEVRWLMLRAAYVLPFLPTYAIIARKHNSSPDCGLYRAGGRLYTQGVWEANPT